MSPSLLAPDEAPPFTVVNPGAASPLLLVGDHAGEAIPRRLGDLGLSTAARRAHIALDIGVGGLGARLAERLEATFIAQRYSRLVVDCNRDPARADSIVEVSDGVAVPGNQGIGQTARAQRIAEILAPYHDRIVAELDARRGRPTLFVSLHSFTPSLEGVSRPWRFGVLHQPGSAFSQAVLERLRPAVGADLVGDNQPYELGEIDYTVPRHAFARGLDYLELEVRQDAIEDDVGQDAVAGLLAPLLADAARSLA